MGTVCFLARPRGTRQKTGPLTRKRGGAVAAVRAQKRRVPTNRQDIGHTSRHGNAPHSRSIHPCQSRMPPSSMTTTRKVLKKHEAKLTPKSDTTPVTVLVDDSARLREIRKLVQANNNSGLDDNLIIAQIYMESRFDSNASAVTSSARGLMQLLKAPVRELYRLKNNDLPRASRQSEASVYADADRFHDSPEFVDEATNIQTGTTYLGYLVRRETSKGAHDAVSEAYKDYRGVRNGIYFRKIKAVADKLRDDPENMQILRDMVK
jgi:hypothetical protein